ncbi:MAG: hypothetical protein C4532_17665 [Candidatus Abyssobacteria bacterium SURF_17]|uniref:Uncharacterized protein n=1 Tax=Candidatus Abyssobacteria bacterium SURF_17 TaxID=2093361 RepID=A0A419EQH5_9BACT|nr:MAG: hypothetical protein C4532_17665 [Candidatus Abyssubacteria bacterium SURF_17]
MAHSSDKHRVLLFGQKVFGPVKLDLCVDYCAIQLLSYPHEYANLGRLAQYDLVILDYSAFTTNGNTDKPRQEIFLKLMVEALDKGTAFCILHYDETVPGEQRYNYDYGEMNIHEFQGCFQSQIGFRWLAPLAIRPFRSPSPIIYSRLKRSEFQLYRDCWGASRNYFATYGEGEFGDIIIGHRDNSALGFAVPRQDGRIIYLPCQRDFERKDDMTECLQTLIGSLVTYLAQTALEVPEWAETPIFTRESEIQKNLTEMQVKIEWLEAQLKPYRTAKRLAFLSQYDFENAVPDFFGSHVDIPILREERYAEDFWLLDQNSKKLVIAESKSTVGGIGKGAVYQLYNHRESNGLDKNFPALLVVNTHLKATSWNKKLKPIDPQAYETAADNNILIIRVEDLLFFWNAITEGKKTKDDFLSLLLNKRGWLEVRQDGSFEIHSNMPKT